MRQRAPLVQWGANVTVAGAVVVQQHWPGVYRLLVFLQLRRHVLGTHLVVDAILAQVAVDSCKGTEGNGDCENEFVLLRQNRSHPFGILRHHKERIKL